MRLVSIDSRCSRQLDPDDRRMVDPPEWEWVRDAVLGTDLRYDHLVLASTLPFLLPPGLHHLEGWDEAISEGAWKRPGKWTGEKPRQALDLEHWASFRASFREVIDLLRDVVGRHRIFFPIALRSTSACPRLNPASACAMRITCSW